MSFSKESRDDSFNIDENITAKLDFIIENSVSLNHLKIHLFKNEVIDLPSESKQKNKTQLKEELLLLENELIKEKSCERKIESGNENEVDNRLSNHLEKIDTVNASLESFLDSFKPLLLSKKNSTSSNIPKLHLKPELVRKQYEIVKSVFEITENSRGAAIAAQQLQDEMKKVNFN